MRTTLGNVLAAAPLVQCVNNMMTGQQLIWITVDREGEVCNTMSGVLLCLLHNVCWCVTQDGGNVCLLFTGQCLFLYKCGEI